jgi:hypothetical protein
MMMMMVMMVVDVDDVNHDMDATQDMIFSNDFSHRHPYRSNQDESTV